MGSRHESGLNRRQMLFAELCVERDFYVAYKCAGYSKSGGYGLLRNVKVKRYMLSLVIGAMEEINLTLGDLIKKRYDLANDIDTPAQLRDNIYKDLIVMAKDVGDETGDRMMRLGAGKNMLKPAKEIVGPDIEEAKIIEESKIELDNSKIEVDNGNGESKEENITEEADSVRGEADNRSTA